MEKNQEFDKNLEKYAEVILKVGLNLQSGQRLVIGRASSSMDGVPLELAPLVRKIVRQAYQMGAKLVEVLWADPEERLIRFEHAPRDSFGEFPDWRAQAVIDRAEAGDAVLSISAVNPVLLAGQDPDLVSTVVKAMTKKLKPFSEIQGKNLVSWSIVAAPVAGWPELVFPGLSSEEATEKFWDVIFDFCRIKEDDPVQAWRDHIARLSKRSDFLNQKRYTELKYTGPGTDLTIGLPPGHIWLSGSMETQQGIELTVNMPTEEVFTLPDRMRTEGTVACTKTVNYGGMSIEGAQLTFKEGRCVKATASKGEDTLNKTISMDDNARFLGEVALVPHSSPISQSGLVFQNILIDENASCHIALGQAYQLSLEGGEHMTGEEFFAAGGNRSLLHWDVMIGSGEIDIDGVTQDGEIESVMRSGEWAVDV